MWSRTEAKTDLQDGRDPAQCTSLAAGGGSRATGDVEQEKEEHMRITSDSDHLPLGDDKASAWYGRHILKVGQFTRADVDRIHGVAAEMQEMVKRTGGCDLLKGKILANMFYEPSTRTSCSFMAAMQRLGGQVIPINEARSSSVAKGESIADTAITLGCYADVMVIRNPEVGSADEAAANAGIPVLNAGDGVGEHPTQALLDTFTMRQEVGRLDNLTVTLLGDLKNGRTVHSLARLLTLFDGIKLNYVAPGSLRMPQDVVDEVAAAGVKQDMHEELAQVLADTDVLYVTRIQKERFATPGDYEKVKGVFVITPETLEGAKDDMIVMHPLPRVNEITVEVDADPRAAYFRQMEYGMYVRMALLALVLGRA
jgi:aspartate carbamoyltransferase